MTEQSDILDLLERGEIVSCRQSLWGSNFTFLVQIQERDQRTKAVYKPRDGETPLWDFPEGTLYIREYAAYLLSYLLGWELVPPTVIRDGPYGVGSVQLYVEHDPRFNYFTLRESHAPQLKAIACFDLVANNADRKAGHCILDREGRVWTIDHGLTFHAITKLRTVMWDYNGQPIPGRLLASLKALSGRLKTSKGKVKRFVELLDLRELTALKKRIEAVLAMGVYPSFSPYRVPWPPV